MRDSRGKIVSVFNRYQNLSELTTSGIDVELRQRWQTQNVGEFGVTAVYTHVHDYRHPQTTGRSDNLTVYTKVENLFNEEPPYDASFQAFALHTTSRSMTCVAGCS